MSGVVFELVAATAAGHHQTPVGCLLGCAGGRSVRPHPIDGRRCSDTLTARADRKLPTTNESGGQQDTIDAPSNLLVVLVAALVPDSVCSAGWSVVHSRSAAAAGQAHSANPITLT